MWFPYQNSHRRPIFLEKTEESPDLDQHHQPASPVSAVLRALGIITIAIIIILGLVFGIGCAIGVAHSLNHSVFASKIFQTEMAKHELTNNMNLRRHIVARAVGWTWWNGAQFGAWFALGSAAFGAAQQMNAGAASWATGVGGGLCYIIAIVGGAAVGTKRSVDGHPMIDVKGDNGERRFLALHPVDLSPLTHNWTTPAGLTWHKVMDNETHHHTFLSSDQFGGHHGIVSFAPAAHANSSSIPKRNEGEDFTSLSSSDYVYFYLEGGNSAREYYYDHSLTDWRNYMPGIAGVVNSGGTIYFQPFCLVPQDSQGNAVASIMVETNFNSYSTGLRCIDEAEAVNPSFYPN